MPFRTRKVEGVPGNSAPAELNCDELWDQALRPAPEELNDMPIRAHCVSHRHWTIGFSICPVGSVASSRACGVSAFRHTHSVGLKKILAIKAARRWDCCCWPCKRWCCWRSLGPGPNSSRWRGLCHEPPPSAGGMNALPQSLTASANRPRQQTYASSRLGWTPQAAHEPIPRCASRQHLSQRPQSGDPAAARHGVRWRSSPDRKAWRSTHGAAQTKGLG